MADENESTFAGACTCDVVRYRMNSAPLIVHCCHCRWCQRETGSAFALNAFIESERLELLQGTVEMVPVPSESGHGQMIARCPICRIALWSHYAGMGEKICVVRVGTLREADRLPPDIHIYTDSKQPWVTLSDDIPAVPEYYRRSLYWTKESLERRTVLLA